MSAGAAQATATAATPEYVLEVSGVTKTFPGVKALDDVSFDVRPGEVHALVGENGAGKSTLMKVLAGNHRPDAGTIRHMGQPVQHNNPLEAKQRGILLVHQELSLVPELTVAENIYLGSMPLKSFGRVDWRALREKTNRVLRDLHCNFRASDIVGRLSIAKQQMVEIARADAFKCNVVIFDEPTASLTDQEKDALFENIHKLKDQGVGIVYISHKMSEIFEITDRITVLRDGKTQGTLNTADTDADEITRMMIGRSLDAYFERADSEPREELLRVEGLTIEGLLRDVSFNVCEGEVVGMYGLVGAGRSEVAETVFGIRKPDAGTIYWRGEAREIASPKDAMKLGIGLVPEDRKEQGLVLGMGGRDNTTLPLLGELNTWGFMQTSRETALFDEYKERMSISTTGPKQPVVNLSGGNQQKFVIAKWMATKPKLLILDEPTRGIDVGSKSEIHKLIARLAESGLAVLVISSEMPEIMGVSHRILTMCEGRLTGDFNYSEVTEDKLLHAATPQE
ncbi:MAG TPA: sugar ABC transporter ATP-binding protein [Gammaproteobacteria bacterium]|nr:sugar ABC transporter ATP-binding protein [Gammaproteobacteria bacterium]